MACNASFNSARANWKSTTATTAAAISARACCTRSSAAPPPCAAMISKEDYHQDIERLKRFLSSKRSVVLRQAHQGDGGPPPPPAEYEQAAHLRDQIMALESLSMSGDPEADVQPEVFFIDPADGLIRLGKILGLEQPPRTIEGIDIANLQGEESCGSLVCFIDGKPFKNSYRRFRIKTVQGIDDYAMIREVITRRYRHAALGEELYPRRDPDRRRPRPASRGPQRLRRHGHSPADGRLARQARGGTLHPGQEQPDPPCRATTRPCVSCNRSATRPTASSSTTTTSFAANASSTRTSPPAASPPPRPRRTPNKKRNTEGPGTSQAPE